MATTINLDEHLLIGGSWIDATGGARFDVTDPATGNKVGSMPNGTEADVQAAIDAAARSPRVPPSAFIERSSVISSPLNPIVPRMTPSITTFDVVDGRSASSAVRSKWAVIP